MQEWLRLELQLVPEVLLLLVWKVLAQGQEQGEEAIAQGTWPLAQLLVMTQCTPVLVLVAGSGWHHQLQPEVEGSQVILALPRMSKHLVLRPRTCRQHPLRSDRIYDNLPEPCWGQGVLACT